MQVERKRRPELIGKPCAVVQYNSFQGGGIIALSYEAKAMGVKRSMRGAQAKEKCPEIQLVTVDVKREKADLSAYREAGEIISDKFCVNLDRQLGDICCIYLFINPCRYMLYLVIYK